VKGGEVVSGTAGRWVGWVFHLNIRKLFNSNSLKFSPLPAADWARVADFWTQFTTFR